MIDSRDSISYDDDSYEKKDDHVISLVDSAHSPEHSLLRSSMASAFDDEVSKDDLFTEEYSRGEEFIMKDIQFIEEDEQNGAGDSAKELPTGRWNLARFYMSMSSYWFAYNAIMSALISIVVPRQLYYIGGEKLKDRYTGLLPVFGIIVSVTIAPLAGSLSDHSKNRYGRRRLFLITGSLIGSVFLMLMAYAGSHVVLFTIFLMGLQFGMNWGGGPYAGLMPDLVPKEQYGQASGYLAFAGAIGNLIGLGGTGLLLMGDSKDQKPPLLSLYLFLVVILFGFTLPTVFGIKEKQLSGFVPKLTIKRFFMSFYLPSHLYRNFYWVLITRFIQEMGIYAVLPFFQYYLQDVIQVEKYATMTSVMLCIIVVTSVPASLIAGPLSNRYGRKLMVYVSCGLMATCTLGFLFISFQPSLYLVMICAGFFGLGYGSYQAVDWALALDCLPENADIAKDMAIWHQTMVIPQAISPFITGMILDSISSKKTAYSIIFSITIVWFFLATVLIQPIKLKTFDHIPMHKNIKDSIEMEYEEHKS